MNSKGLRTKITESGETRRPENRPDSSQDGALGLQIVTQVCFYGTGSKEASEASKC